MLTALFAASLAFAASDAALSDEAATTAEAVGTSLDLSADSPADPAESSTEWSGFVLGASGANLELDAMADAETMAHRRRPPPPPPPRYRRGPPPPPPARHVVVHRRAPAAAPAQPDLHSVTLTVSAVHLALPMATMNAEFRLGQQGGLGITGGFGTAQGQSLYELGVEARGYFVGNFDSGLFLAGGVRATDVPFYEPTDSAVAGALALGGKYTFDLPITLEGEIGPQIVGSSGWKAVGPMVKVNLGFSF